MTHYVNNLLLLAVASFQYGYPHVNGNDIKYRLSSTEKRNDQTRNQILETNIRLNECKLEFHFCLCDDVKRSLSVLTCLSCLSLTLCCGQTVGWIKMPLGMEV